MIFEMFIIGVFIISLYTIYKGNRAHQKNQLNKENDKIRRRNANEKQFKLLQKQFETSLVKLIEKLQLGNELDKDMFEIYHVDSLRKVYAENGQMFLRDVYYVDIDTFMEHKKYKKGYEDFYEFAEKQQLPEIAIETINNKITKIRY